MFKQEKEDWRFKGSYRYLNLYRCIQEVIEESKKLIDKVKEQITSEDMPTENMKIIAETCGIDIAIKILKNLGGLSLYIPSSGISLIHNKYILKRYDGTRDCANRLALELGVSINYVYKILKQKQ